MAALIESGFNLKSNFRPLRLRQNYKNKTGDFAAWSLRKTETLTNILSNLSCQLKQLFYQR